MRTNRVLVIMAKAPRPGAVKTRLADSLPQEAVMELYQCLLKDTLALAHELDHVDVAVMCPAADVEDLLQALGKTVPVAPQTGQGLAAGLVSVFTHFVAAGYKRVIAFNSDSPHLPASVLEAAFDLLETRDLVVGPTHDGGYYLVGAKATVPALFEGDQMGTANALEALRARARTLQLSMGFTDPFCDVDVAADLIPLAAELQRAPARAPRTAVWLKDWEHVVAQLQTGTKKL